MKINFVAYAILIFGTVPDSLAQDPDNCVNINCMNGGTCQNTDGSFECQCVQGFTEDRCQINTDDCVNFNCMNGGTCQDLVDGFVCQCVQGFTGKNCQIGQLSVSDRSVDAIVWNFINFLFLYSFFSLCT